jgi:hypothetical protein
MTGPLARLRRGAFLLVVLALATSGLPRAERAHCSVAGGEVAGHHQDGHGGGHQDAESPADCPHCPPSQCAAQTHCAPVLDLATAPGASAGPALPVPALRPVPALSPSSHFPQPTPPPPQAA